MPQVITLFLSKEGFRALGREVFELPSQAKHVVGTLLSRDAEGVWFQDAKLLRDNRMVLVKWSFIDTIISEMRLPEVPERRGIGFRAADLITGE